MGCGGSSTYNEDGSIAAGQGETTITWNADKPCEVGFYYYSGKSAKIMLKEFPMDKECAEKVFEEKNCSSNGDMHWVKVVPGNRYAMKYTEDGNSVCFPGQEYLEIPKKIGEFYKDEDKKKKLAEDLKKDVEKDENNAYSKDGGEDKINADIDAMGNAKSCAEFPAEMDKFRMACMTTEDLQPWNLINANLDIKNEFGTWEEKDGKMERQMAMADTIKQKAAEEVSKKGPEVPAMGFIKAQEVFGKVIDGAVEGACKKAGPAKDELAPNLADRLAYMDGVAPSATRASERKKAEGGEEAAKEEAAEEGDPVENAAKKEYEAQKGNLDALKSADGNDRKGAVESYLKAVYGSISDASVAADAEKAVIGNDKGFQFPVYITGEDGDDATVNFAETNFGDESAGKIKKGDGAFTSLPEAKNDFLVRGQSVVVKNGKAFNQCWVKSVDGDDVTVESQFMVESKVKAADCYTNLTQQSIASRGIALMPNFAPLNFTWVAEQDPNVTERKVRVWRFGAYDTLQEADLAAFTVPKKPTAECEKPEGENHGGFRAEVPVLCGAKYAVNYKIGDKYYTNFGAECGEKGCAVFTCNARVEY